MSRPMRATLISSWTSYCPFASATLTLLPSDGKGFIGVLEVSVPNTRSRRRADIPPPKGGTSDMASFPALPVRTAIDSSAGARMRTSAVTNRPESASDSFRNRRTGPLPRAWRDLGEIGSNCSAPRPVIHPIDQRLSQDRSNHGNPRKPTRVSTGYHVARSLGRRRAVNIVEGGAPFRQTSDDDRPQELHCPGRVSAANASPSRKLRVTPVTDQGPLPRSPRCRCRFHCSSRQHQLRRQPRHSRALACRRVGP
jgi:hypothetical protein